MAVTYQDICLDALREIGVLTGSDPAESDMADQALNRLIRIVDLWNAEQERIYDNEFTVYTLTPLLQPHTIGPAGTFNVTQRPVAIDGANLVLNTSSPAVRIPLEMLSEDEWMYDVRVRAQTGTIPRFLFYQAEWPLGSISLWPIPTVAYQIELLTRLVLAEPTLATVFSMPPGYREALTLTLAEAMTGPMMVPMPALLPSLAAKARATINANNVAAPKIATQDAGMPGGNNCGGRYLNWIDRTFVP
jgi:hypothetical protein